MAVGLALDKYPDLKPFHAHVEITMMAQTGRTAEQFRADVQAMRDATAAKNSSPDDPFVSIRSGLRNRGLTEDAIAIVMLKAEEEVPSHDFFLMAESAGRLAEAQLAADDAARCSEAKMKAKTKGRAPTRSPSAKVAKAEVPSIGDDLCNVTEALSF